MPLPGKPATSQRAQLPEAGRAPGPLRIGCPEPSGGPPDSCQPWLPRSSLTPALSVGSRSRPHSLHDGVSQSTFSWETNAALPSENTGVGKGGDLHRETQQWPCRSPWAPTASSDAQGFLTPLSRPSLDIWYSVSWLFKLVLNFIRSNIIYYIIKCKTYIIKISQHFTDRLIKISGAVPRGINSRAASSRHCSACRSTRSWALLPGRRAHPGRAATRAGAAGPRGHFLAPPDTQTTRRRLRYGPSADVGSSHSPQGL